mgnify:CR=1 FL=1
MSIILNGTTGITSTGITETSDGNVGIGTSAPAQILEVKELDQTGFTGIRVNNPTELIGSAGIEFQVDPTYSKAAIYQTRKDPNGVGDLIFAVDSATDAANWAATDEKMRIDSAGRVTMPYQPSFYADVSSTTTFQGNVSNAVAIFNRATVNIGNHYSTATGKFTAPVAGTYVFSIGAVCSSPISQFWFVVNGNRSESFLVAAAGAQNGILSASGMMRLQSGDSLGVLPYTGTANVSLNPSGLHAFFRGHLLG